MIDEDPITPDPGSIRVVSGSEGLRAASTSMVAHIQASSNNAVVQMRNAIRAMDNLGDSILGTTFGMESLIDTLRQNPPIVPEAGDFGETATERMQRETRGWEEAERELRERRGRDALQARIEARLTSRMAADAISRSIEDTIIYGTGPRVAGPVEAYTRAQPSQREARFSTDPHEAAVAAMGESWIEIGGRRAGTVSSMRIPTSRPPPEERTNLTHRDNVEQYISFRFGSTIATSILTRMLSRLQDVIRGAMVIPERQWWGIAGALEFEIHPRSTYEDIYRVITRSTPTWGETVVIRPIGSPVESDPFGNARQITRSVSGMRVINRTMRGKGRFTTVSDPDDPPT